MNIIARLVKRLRFRQTIKTDESVNVIDSMAKARVLYKSLAVATHPDKNPEKREIAEELMRRITANRYNYSALVSLKKEVDEKLLK